MSSSQQPGKQGSPHPQSPLQPIGSVPSPAMQQQPHTPQSQPPPSPQQTPMQQHNSNSNSSSSNSGPVKPSSVPSFIGAGSSFAAVASTASAASLPNGLPPPTIPANGGQPPHTNSSSNSAAPSSLPVNVPHTPPAATPASGQSPAIHPSVESSLAASNSIGLRTHSPAVATSAALSAAVTPTGLLNGSHATHPGIPHSAAMMLPNGLGSIPPHYRAAYPGYPLYAPYGSFQHNPYLPPSVAAPNLSPRMHPGAPPGLGGIPPSMLGLGLMDSRLQHPLAGANGSPSHLRDRDASPMGQPPSKIVRPITPNANSNGSNSNSSSAPSATAAAPPHSSSGSVPPPSSHIPSPHGLSTGVPHGATPPSSHPSLRDQPPSQLSHPSLGGSSHLLPPHHPAAASQQQPPPPPLSSHPQPPASHLVGPSSHHPLVGPLPPGMPHGSAHHLSSHLPPTSSSSGSSNSNSAHLSHPSISASARTHSPRGHSPNRERDSYR